MNLKPIIIKDFGEKTIELFTSSTNEIPGDVKRKIFSSYHKNLKLIWEGKVRSEDFSKKLESYDSKRHYFDFQFNVDHVFLFESTPKTFSMPTVVKKEIKPQVRWDEKNLALLFQGSADKVSKLVGCSASAVSQKRSDLKQKDYKLYIQLLNASKEVIPNTINVSPTRPKTRITKTAEELEKQDLVLLVFENNVKEFIKRYPEYQEHYFYSRKSYIKNKMPKYYEALKEKARHLKPLDFVKQEAQIKGNEIISTMKNNEQISLKNSAFVSLQSKEEIEVMKDFLKKKDEMLQEQILKLEIEREENLKRLSYLNSTEVDNLYK